MSLEPSEIHEWFSSEACTMQRTRKTQTIRLRISQAEAMTYQLTREAPFDQEARDMQTTSDHFSATSHAAAEHRQIKIL